MAVEVDSIPEVNKGRRMPRRLVVRSRLAGFVREYPVTFSVVAPFSVLIILPALIFSNEHTGFIVKIYLIAMGASIFGEILVKILSWFFGARGTRFERLIAAQRTVSPWVSRAAWRVGLLTLVLASLAKIVGAQAGVGTIESQVAGGEAGAAGAVASIAALAAGMDVVGLGLVIWARAMGAVSKRAFGWTLISATAVAFVHAVMLAVTAPAFKFVVVMVVSLLFVGLLRVRTTVLILLLVLVAWPALYAVRNEARADQGVEVSQEVSAYDRLRYDLQVADAAELTAGQDIGQVTGWEVFRYGLVPRVFDPDRPPLNTGMLINTELLGGAETSSATFLPVATAYVLVGVRGMIILYFSLALVPLLLLGVRRSIGPWSFSAMTTFNAAALGWFSVYPASVVLFLQNLVYLTVIIVAVRVYAFLRL